MKRFVFITGGARSGKSSFAQRLAARTGRKVTFIATCEPLDREMVRRIKIHKKARPAEWKTLDVPRDMSASFKLMRNHGRTLLIDCLGLYISNMLCGKKSERAIKREIVLLAKFLSGYNGYVILVSNEAGSGIVPENKLARDFRDMLGMANQAMAMRADDVYIMHAGIPVKIK